jgi:hypothetical protein
MPEETGTSIEVTQAPPEANNTPQPFESPPPAAAPQRLARIHI